MRPTIIIPAILLAFFSAPSIAQTVSVTGGKIQGSMLEGGGAVFKGIPYAAPPVGPLRWREPAPVSHWNDVRSAQSFGPACAQLPSIINPDGTSEENCLYLNVWTAEWPSKSPKAVIVWIPGGGNFGGAASQAVYDSDSLARRGIVLVTLNYRLGAFGFFSHPDLTRESPHHASGNQGLLDQIAALKWVHDNIAKFGGNPGNVTIYGSSAGGLDDVILMTSPLAKGLFRRVIAGSAPLAPSDSLIGKIDNLAQAEKRGETLASHWTLSPNASISDLRKISTEDILKSLPNYTKTREAYKQTTLIESFPHIGIIADGYVVPSDPTEMFSTGKTHRVALLLGSNLRDWVPGTRPPNDLNAAIEDIFGPLSERAKALYKRERDPIYGAPESQFQADASFRCGSVAQLIWHTSAGNPAYEYEYAHTATGRETLGPTHAEELPFVFGTLDKGFFTAFAPPARPNAIDAQVSDAMQRYWTNFAKTGDPNGPGLPVWPKFDPDRRAYIQFTDAGPVAKEGLRRPYCDLFIENLKRPTPK